MLVFFGKLVNYKTSELTSVNASPATFRLVADVQSSCLSSAPAEL